MNIEDIDMKARTYNCIKRAGIDTIEQLLERNINDIKYIRNLGQEEYEEVLGIIENYKNKTMNNISMSYDFENKAYVIYCGEIVHMTVYNWLDSIKEFRWLQRKMDKEVE